MSKDHYNDTIYDRECDSCGEKTNAFIGRNKCQIGQEIN